MCKAISDIENKAKALGEKKTQEEMRIVAPYIKEGKDDSFISKLLNISEETIRQYRSILSIML